MSTLARREHDGADPAAAAVAAPVLHAPPAPAGGGIGAVPVSAVQVEDRAIRAIALFKLAKGVLFLLLAVGALRLINHDATEVAHYWLKLLGIKQESRWVHEMLEHAGPFIDTWRKLISPLLTFYAAIFFTEGIGLLLRKPWAEWLTVIVTASLIPLEIYEVFHHTNVLKIMALLINSGIVWFLVAHIRHTRARRRSAGDAAHG